MESVQSQELRLKQAKDEVQRYIENGTPIVDLSIFDHLDSLQINEKSINQADYTKEIYFDLLEQIYKMPKDMVNLYLTTLKNSDIIDNQTMEKENPFMIALYRSFTTDALVDILINNYGKKITKNDFVKRHDLLLEGTSSDDKLGLRDNNLKFVGTWENGQRNIQYFPILDENIDEALNRFVDYYNTNINNMTNEYDAFIKPIIYHGLIAALQLFKDGNTRYARLLQHTELWGMLNNSTNLKSELPILYATRQYFAYRNEYRNLIKNIAIQNDNEAWNNWILFNLRRMQDNIYANELNVKQFKMKFSK